MCRCGGVYILFSPLPSSIPLAPLPYPLYPLYLHSQVMPQEIQGGQNHPLQVALLSANIYGRYFDEMPVYGAVEDANNTCKLKYVPQSPLITLCCHSHAPPLDALKRASKKDDNKKESTGPQVMAVRDAS